MAALRSPDLIQTDFRFQKKRTDPSPETRSLLISTLTAERLTSRRAALERITRLAVTRLPDRGVCDLVADLIQPWSVAITMEVLDAGWARRPAYSFLARNAPGNLTASPASSGVSGLLRSKAAGWLLRRMFRGPAAMARRSLFLGLSQTLPAFLTHAWLTLLQNPHQMARLRLDPSLMLGAVEELLRHAGHVQTLYREATAPLMTGKALIAAGDRVILQMASANRDPARFADPHRLDLGRRVVSHVALGAGPHSCAGAATVRVLASMATGAFLARWESVRLCGEVSWNRGPTLSWPVFLPVALGARPDVMDL